MEYKEFLNVIEDGVRNYTRSDSRVMINHVIKNNGQELDGLVIMEHGQSIAPAIYVNDYYKQHKGGRSTDDIIDEIFDRYYECQNSFEFGDVDIEEFKSYANIRKNVVYRLVNYEKNKKLLGEVPHEKIMDLAMVFYCYYGTNNGVSGSVLIKNIHMRMWRTDMQTLLADAVSNTPKLLPSIVKPMSSMLHDIAGLAPDGFDAPGVGDFGSFVEDYDMVVTNKNADMYIVTNKIMLNGASVMMYDGTLSALAEEIDMDLYVLPSSIHELIVIPARPEFDVSVLKDMVCTINLEEVDADEVLSDSVYYYSRNDNEIRII